MKPEIHPAYHLATVTCACGTVYEIGTTRADFSRVDICSACHPLFTGKQKLMDIEGRVERFRKRYAGSTGKTAAAPKTEKAPRARRRVQNVLEGLKSIRKPTS